MCRVQFRNIPRHGYLGTAKEAVDRVTRVDGWKDGWTGGKAERGLLLMQRYKTSFRVRTFISRRENMLSDSNF